MFEQNIEEFVKKIPQDMANTVWDFNQYYDPYQSLQEEVYIRPDKLLEKMTHGRLEITGQMIFEKQPNNSTAFPYNMKATMAYDTKERLWRVTLAKDLSPLQSLATTYHLILGHLYDNYIDQNKESVFNEERDRSWLAKEILCKEQKADLYVFNFIDFINRHDLYPDTKKILYGVACEVKR